MTQSRNKCVSVNTNSQHVYYFIHIFVTLKRGGIETQPKVVVTQLCIHSPNTDSEMAYTLPNQALRWLTLCQTWLGDGLHSVKPGSEMAYTLPNEMAYTLPYLAL